MTINCDKLALLLIKRGYSALELSKVSGISQVTISRLKAGNQKPRPQTIYKIAKALNVEVEDLLQE